MTSETKDIWDLPSNDPERLAFMRMLSMSMQADFRAMYYALLFQTQSISQHGGVRAEFPVSQQESTRKAWMEFIQRRQRKEADMQIPPADKLSTLKEIVAPARPVYRHEYRPAIPTPSQQEENMRIERKKSMMKKLGPTPRQKARRKIFAVLGM
jgi:hypothetical protein